MAADADGVAAEVETVMLADNAEVAAYVVPAEFAVAAANFEAVVLAAAGRVGSAGVAAAVVVVDVAVAAAEDVVAEPAAVAHTEAAETVGRVVLIVSACPAHCGSLASYSSVVAQSL